MNDRLLFSLRAVMALVWLFNGLWLKILAVDSRHLLIVSGLAGDAGLEPGTALAIIGLAETVLALLILAGVWSRAVQAAQIGLVLAMNCAGILFGGGTIENPAGLIISNLPLIACATVVLLEGPGSWRMRTGK